MDDRIMMMVMTTSSSINVKRADVFLDLRSQDSGVIVGFL